MTVREPPCNSCRFRRTEDVVLRPGGPTPRALSLRPGIGNSKSLEFPRGPDAAPGWRKPSARRTWCRSCGNGCGGSSDRERRAPRVAGAALGRVLIDGSWVSGGAPMSASTPTPVANPCVRALPLLANSGRSAFVSMSAYPPTGDIQSLCPLRGRFGPLQRDLT